VKKKAFFFLFLSGGVALFFVFLFYPLIKYVWGENERYRIRTIVQKRSPQDTLKCAYLAEVLGLSSDRKSYLYRFNIKEGEKRLQENPLIKKAIIKKVKPHTLFVDYALRKPIAYVADFANTAVDEAGVLFPFAPFYTPKNLPEVYFADAGENQVWGRRIGEAKMRLVREILELFPAHSLSWIDLSKSESEHLGEKEIIVGNKKHLLRLSKGAYKKEIGYYALLNQLYLDSRKECCTIDFRLPDVAFIKFNAR